MNHKTLYPRLAQLIVLTVGLLLAASFMTARSSAANDELKFEDATELTATLAADATEVTKTLTLRNNSSREATVELSTILLDADNNLINAQVKVLDKENKRQDTMTIPAGRAAPISAIMIVPNPFKLPLSGHLIAASTDGQLSPAGRPLKIASPPPAAWAWPDFIPNPLDAGASIVIGSLLLAALIVLLLRAFWLPRRGIDFSKREYVKNGLPDWSPIRSFVSNFTIFSGIFGAILSANLLPEKTVHHDKSNYVFLSICFGALLIIGPVIFNMNLDKRRSQEDPTKLETYGRITALLWTTGFVLWALLGQLLTMSLITDELRVGSVLDGSLITTFHILLALVTLVLLVYIFVTLPKVIGTGNDPEATAVVLPKDESFLDRIGEIIGSLGKKEHADLLRRVQGYVVQSNSGAGLIPEENVTRQKWPLF